MRRLPVGHGQRLKVKAFRLCPLAEQLPIMAAVIKRRGRAMNHRITIAFGPNQAAECLARQNQAGAHLEHLSGCECRRQIRKHDCGRIIDRLFRLSIARDAVPSCGSHR